MWRPILLASIVTLAASHLWADERVETPPERAFSAFASEPERQFDFWIGQWIVNLRIQQEDLSFKDSVRARAHIYRILNGKAILELWDSTPIKGYSLRYFDPKKGKWVLWLTWPSNNRSGVSSLEGEFRHGRGSFHSSYTNAQGEEITERYSFNDITPFSLRWDDLYSKDGGKTWSKNWRMEFSRTAVDPDWPIDPDNVPTFVDGQRCDAESFRPYEAIVGSWTGADARLDAYRVLDGCAVMGFLETSKGHEFVFLTYTGEDTGWETNVLDDRPDTPLARYTSTKEWTHLEADAGRLEWSISDGRLTYTRDGREVRLRRTGSQ